MELTAYSVRSCLAPASGSSSCPAFWRTRFARPPECGAHFVCSLVRQRASRRRTRLLHLSRRPSSLWLAVPRAGERRIRCREGDMYHVHDRKRSRVARRRGVSSRDACRGCVSEYWVRCPSIELVCGPESGKGREIDVIATDPDHIGIVEIHFVVECESSKKPWVLLTSEDVLSNYNRLFALGVLSKDVLKSFAHRTGELMDTLPWLRKSSRSGYALRHAFSGSHDFAYSAAMSVAKACDSLVRPLDARYIAPFILVFPVIVIDTPLFECTLQSNGQLQLDEVSQGEFLFVARLPSRFGSCIRVHHRRLCSNVRPGGKKRC